MLKDVLVSKPLSVLPQVYVGCVLFNFVVVAANIAGGACAAEIWQVPQEEACRAQMLNLATMGFDSRCMQPKPEQIQTPQPTPFRQYSRSEKQGITELW